jgi:hypothetical protein
MKAELMVIGLIAIFMLAACTTATMPAPNETAISSQTPTSIPPSATPTFWVTPAITATPLNMALSERGEIDSLIEQLHPGICTGDNLALLTPPPIDVPPPTKLEITQVDTPPDPSSHYVSEIADNIDSSLQAFIACEPEKCVDSVYVKNNEIGKVYRVYFGGLTYRPLQWLTWVNKDTFIVAQSSNPHYGLFVAINFNKREYVYYGMARDCWDTPTPTQ